MPSPPRAISRIRVGRLFGTYDYDLCPGSDGCDVDRVWILYGDNGSGKTTILRTLFHLLAPEDGESHKTAVAGIPFGRFEVEFTSGERVWAERSDDRIIGTFTMGLKLAGKKELRQEFVANEEGVVRKTQPKADLLQSRFLESLGELNVGLFFLSDDRTVRLAGRDRRDMPFASPTFFVDEEEVARMRMRGPGRRVSQEVLEHRAKALLVESVRRAEWWIQSQAVHKSSEGESSVNALYAEILKRVSRLPLDQNPEPKQAVSEIEGLVGRLEKRSRRFAQYGLLPEFTGRDILSVVRGVPRTHLNIVTNVVAPYIESVEKKLDAMAQLQRQIDALITTLNSFFTQKSISFSLRSGFSIVAASGERLSLEMLSSGERHLLLLFCNTLLALDRPSIFIIDEPEISLNIKWQRRLLASLLECAGESPIQYLFATHSFELLARHKNSTIKLIETSA